MTHDTSSPLPASPGGLPPSGRQHVPLAVAAGGTSGRDLARAARTAGAALVLMAVLGVSAQFLVLERVVVPGDGAATAAAVLANELGVRAAVLGLLTVVLLDVVVAAALYRLLRPAGEGLALTAAWLRVAYAGAFLVAIGHLLHAPRLLTTGDGEVAVADQAEALAAFAAYADLWDLALILFGLHLVLVGLLCRRSGYVPRALGVLVVVAGLGYLLDGAITVLVPDTALEVSVVTFVGELLLAVWLLVRGGRLAAPIRAESPGASR